MSNNSQERFKSNFKIDSLFPHFRKRDDIKIFYNLAVIIGSPFFTAWQVKSIFSDMNELRRMIGNKTCFKQEIRVIIDNRG